MLGLIAAAVVVVAVLLAFGLSVFFSSDLNLYTDDGSASLTKEGNAIGHRWMLRVMGML